MFYLTAPSDGQKSSINKKALLQKQLDADYVSTELLNKRGNHPDFLHSNNKRYKPIGPKKRSKTKSKDKFTEQLSALDELLSLTQTKKKHQLFQKNKKHYTSYQLAVNKEYDAKLEDQYKSELQKLIGKFQTVKPYNKAQDDHELVMQFIKPLEDAVTNYNKPRGDSASDKIVEHYKRPLEDIVVSNDFVKPLKKLVSNLQGVENNQKQNFYNGNQPHKKPREKLNVFQEQNPLGDLVLNENNKPELNQGDRHVPYDEEVLAILNDVQKQAATINKEELKSDFQDLQTEHQDLETEFQFENLVA